MISILKINKLKLLFIILAIVNAFTVIAGPVVIEDNRVADLAATPVLGRGYTISTNTYQSTCLTDVKITEPSYDFTYFFKSIEMEGEGTLDDVLNTRSLTENFRNELIKRFAKNENTEAAAGERRYYYHNIFVEINLHSYYASLDESSTKMGNSASKLISNGDLPGFFSSCGSYYVRSIGRRSRFISVFTYKTEDQKPDTAFENNLENQIKGFGQSLKENVAALKDAALSSVDFAKRDFVKECSRRELTITTAAFGMGKNENATLISYDIDTFRNSIADAFLAMQNPGTGKVSTIEVVPWVENTDFQALTKLDAYTEGENGKELLMYEKKQILSSNAEFLAEIERFDRSLLNRYYKAMLCRKHIDINYKNNKILKNEYQGRMVLNNNGNGTLLLNDLDNLLTEDKIDKLFEKEQSFMYGKGDGESGASLCMKNIMEKGIFRIRYKDIPSCTPIIRNMVNEEEEKIENYCLPVLSDRKEK
ncbi:MAG TPA: hypothetical protein PKG60_06680 [Spirochaetota bacterium]|mgnify:CR=1 FL=1|nr:hypothetical protein [Spirochaetota bacterium]HPS86619.1 hypothetical protein [Spirochaetota bacterium]